MKPKPKRPEDVVSTSVSLPPIDAEPEEIAKALFQRTPKAPERPKGQTRVLSAPGGYIDGGSVCRGASGRC